MKTVEQINRELTNKIFNLNKKILNLSILLAKVSYNKTGQDLSIGINKLESLLLERNKFIKEIDKLPRNYRKQLIKCIL